jgi:hypothetical protein
MSLYETVVRDIEGLFQEGDDLLKEENGDKTATAFGRKGLGSMLVEDNGEDVIVHLTESVVNPLLHTNYNTKPRTLYLAWGGMCMSPVMSTSTFPGNPFPSIAFHFQRQAYLERKDMLLSLFRLTIDMHEVNFFGPEIGL